MCQMCPLCYCSGVAGALLLPVLLLLWVSLLLQASPSGSQRWPRPWYASRLSDSQAGSVSGAGVPTPPLLLPDIFWRLALLWPGSKRYVHRLCCCYQAPVVLHFHSRGRKPVPPALTLRRPWNRVLELWPHLCCFCCAPLGCAVTGIIPAIPSVPPTICVPVHPPSDVQMCGSLGHPSVLSTGILLSNRCPTS